MGPVYVAADSEAIFEVIAKAGGRAVLTGEAIFRHGPALAAEIVDPTGKHQVVINQQGDMPFLNPSHRFAAGLKDIVEMDPKCVARIFFGTTVKSHIGLYAFTRRHCEVSFPAAERARKGRPLGAVAGGWANGEIAFIELPHMPQEVNTPEDLEAANAMIKAAGSSQ